MLHNSGTHFRYLTLALNKILDIIHLFIAMCLSELLLQNILVGGAMYLTGQVFIVYVRLYNKRKTRLPRSIRAESILFFFIAFFLSVILFLIYPRIARHPRFPVFLISLFLLLAEQFFTVFFTSRANSSRRLMQVCILSALHLLFFAATWLLLGNTIEAAHLWSILFLLGVCSMFSLCIQILDLHKKSEPFVLVHTDGDFQQVSSYRVYNRMISSVCIALHLAIITYICYMRFHPLKSMVAAFFELLIWLAFVAGISGLMFLFLRRRTFRKYDRISVFVIGALMFIAVCIGMHRYWFTTFFGYLLSYILLGCGLGCMLSVIISLNCDVKAVLEFSLGPMEESDYQANTFAMIEWRLTQSTILFLIMMTILSFLMEGRLDQMEAVYGLRELMRSLMLLLPLIFMTFALLYALMQPLDRSYTQKLRRYISQQRQGNVNIALETQLQLKLVQTTRRIGPSIVRAFLRPLLPCKVINRDVVNASDGPVVFVCNHLEIYGPLITNLHIPFPFRPWVISSMLSKECIAEQLQGGVDAVFHWLPKRIRKRIPSRIAPLMLWVMHAADPIPVYRGQAKDVIKTIHATVEAMEYEDNILLFPENPEQDGEGYPEEGVTQFFSGFANIGREYYKKTDRCTTFYPIYVNKKQRTLTFGEGITFDPTQGKSAEKDRIVMYLYQWMQTQAKK